MNNRRPDDDNYYLVILRNDEPIGSIADNPPGTPCLTCGTFSYMIRRAEQLINSDVTIREIHVNNRGQMWKQVKPQS